jgi:diguanylate cyclase (GGDEF)-like protein
MGSWAFFEGQYGVLAALVLGNIGLYVVSEASHTDHTRRAVASLLILSCAGLWLWLSTGLVGLMFLATLPVMTLLLLGMGPAVLGLALIAGVAFPLAYRDGLLLTPSLMFDHPGMAWGMVAAVFFCLSFFMLLLIARLMRQMEQALVHAERVQHRMHQDALYDKLTGLANRQLLEQRIEDVLLTANNESSEFALLFIDLDNFKTLNDTHGHEEGDELLRMVAKRLNQTLRIQDMVSRTGGDEFLVLLTGLPMGPSGVAMALAEAERLREVMLQPFDMAVGPYTISISLGLTLPQNLATMHAAQLLRQADIAMYEAKSMGRNRVVLYEPWMQTRLQTKVALEHDLSKAVERQQLALVVQSQFNERGEVKGAELLIRWEHPERGTVPPSEFIPLAEQNGLIVPMGEWMLRQACQLAQALEMAGVDCPLSVNVSPRQFSHPHFVRKLLGLLAAHKVPPERLILEVTEGMFLGDIEGTTHTMNTLSAIGFRFSIDDFGTGYSSLSYLKNLPLYELKIDRSFVKNLPGNANDGALVQLILTLAKTLGLKVVAEGIEDETQARFLFDRGCDHLQGFYLARPVHPEDWLQAMVTR